MFKKIRRVPKLFLRRLRYVWKRRRTGFSRAVIADIRSANGSLQVIGLFYATDKIDRISFVTRKFREESVSFTSEATITAAPLFIRIACLVLAPIARIHVRKFHAATAFDWSLLPNSIYSFSLETDVRRASVGFPKRCNSHCRIDDRTLLYAYRDPVVRAVRLEKFNLTQSELDGLIEYGRKTRRSPKPVCLVCEYTNSARDNGWALFRSLRRSTDVVSAYVVEEGNRDGVITDGVDVIGYGTVGHLKYCLDSDVIAFSHHRTYGYPYFLKSIFPERHDATKSLFLQHGVMALKRSPIRHYNFSTARYDAVCVSSKREKEIFEEEFDYPSSSIFITGLARHDQLRTLLMPNNVRDQILIFPTWRQGIEKADSTHAMKDRFFQEWRNAVWALKAIINLEVTVILHPIIEHHRELFADVADNLETSSSFQDILTKSACLITDYSSVAFEAIYADCPVYFFQFDQEEFQFKTDAFIDIDTEMPGPVACTVDDLSNMVARGAETGWERSEIARLYFDHFDTGNADRIKDVIVELANRGAEFEVGRIDNITENAFLSPEAS